MKYLKLFESYNNIEYVYHATLKENLDKILEEGLKPMGNQIHGAGQISTDRVFLSKYNDVTNMYLPMDKLKEDLVVLKIPFSFFKGKEDMMYPDDSIYLAYYNDQLNDNELRKIVPDKYYLEYKKSNSELPYSDWLIENDIDYTPEELDNLLKGKYYLTLFNEVGSSIDLGEFAFKGRIPPEFISIHHHV